ncbi:MAG TPA: beta-phosphoglucomutase family hydrolase [Pseudonocardiaceae bacterium]|nr:beta-phosphoglucomutase family hydrolase [Pseudonocardiaceae bacterium]
MTSTGLPEPITACLFDMDGVLTDTAALHAAAWKRTFDDYLRMRAARSAVEFVPFDSVADYDSYVDGKPREDGVRDFLAAREIRLPEGEPDDSPDAETVHGLGNRKNELVQHLMSPDTVHAYPGSLRYLDTVRQAGLRTAVVSSSANAAQVLSVAGLTDALDVRIDGTVAEIRKLKGKPAPDTFLAAAQELGTPPEHAAVFEDALAGVAAGRAGKFGFVIGVDRAGQAEELRRHGADIVVRDLAELLAAR